MVLTGDGGDELFCGYDKQRDFFTPEVAALDEATFRRRYHESISLFRTADKSALYAHPSFAGLNDSYHLVEGHFQRASRLDRINQVLHLDTALLLPGNNLVKPDRMGMAMSIEARNPFLDVRMVELAFAMPGALKLRDGITKWIFKRSVEELIGSHLAYRKKQMFTVPVGEWFKDRLRPLVTGVLDDPRTRARGLFQPQRVTALMDEHFTGRVNRTREIRALLALELWFRACIDQTFDHAPTFAELGISQVRSTG
jgi:asparagine synthase (glutamine-hydrolysing)